MTVARVCWLESNPQGFFVDEAASVLPGMCIAERGTDAMRGDSYPIYFDTDYGGIVGPTYVYSAALVDRFIGRSRGAFRAINAWATVLTTLGVFAFAHTLFGRQAAWWSFLAATVSPWGFQYSRIAWEDSLYPMFFVWGLYLLLTAERLSRGAAAGIVLALAAYSYGPARCAVPLMYTATWIFRWAKGRFRWPAFVTSFAFLGLSSYSIVHSMLFSSLNARWNQLSIFRDLGEHGISGVAATFIANMARHFSWSFLFERGDELILRHTTGHLGVWSWLDGLGVLAFVILWLIPWRRITSEHSIFSRPALPESLYLLFGVLAGVAPAALTWDSLPHSLRGIGSWPFVALLSGYGISLAEIRLPRFTPLVTVGLTSLFVGRYLWVYFAIYPADLQRPENRDWFSLTEFEIAEHAAATDGWEEFRANKDVATPVRRTYLLLAHHERCGWGIPALRNEQRQFWKTPLGIQLAIIAGASALLTLFSVFFRRLSPLPR